MKRFFVIFALLMLVAGAANAQMYIYENQNEIGVYTTATPTGLIANQDAETSYTGAPGGAIMAYVVVTNPWNQNTNTAIDLVGGFEFHLYLPANVFLLGQVLPPSATNFATAPDFYVGCAAPVVNGAATLLTLTLGEFSGTPGYVSLGPVLAPAPSRPGNMAITDYNDGFSISLAYPVSGDYNLPVFGMYQPVVPNDDATWGGVKSLYR